MRYSGDSIFILDKSDQVIGMLSNNLPSSTPYWDDEHHEVLENGYETLEFKTLLRHPTGVPDQVKEENKVLIRDMDGNSHVFRIRKVIENTITKEKNVFAETEAVELLNDPVRPMTISGSPSILLAAVLQPSRWQAGIVETAAINTLKVEEYSSVLAQLHATAAMFKLEIRFRIEFKNNRVVGRYVDLLQRRGNPRGGFFEYSQDIKGLTRTKDTTELATALIGVGRSDESDNILTFKNVVWNPWQGHPADKPGGQDWIGDESALQQFGVEGRHIFRVYTSDQTDPAQLLAETWDELQRRIKGSVEYEVDLVVLERLAGYEHKAVRIGDTIIIKDTSFTKPLTLEARVLEIKRSRSNPANDAIILGEYREREIKEIELIRQLQAELARNVAKWQSGFDVTESDVPPLNPYANQYWLDTSKEPNIWMRWSTDTNRWIPATPSEATQIDYLDGLPLEHYKPKQPGADVTGDNVSKDTGHVGGLPSETVKDNVNKIIYEVGNGTFETVEGALVKAGPISPTPPYDPQPGQKWIDTSNPDVEVWKRWDGTAKAWVEIGRVSFDQLTGLVKGNQIGLGEVGEQQLADLAVTMKKIANESVDVSKIVDNAISAAKIQTDAITNVKIANNAVDINKIVDNAISAAKIQSSAVTDAKIAANAVTTAKILDGAIANAKIAANAVTEAKINTGAVTTTKILDGAIANAKIAADAVTDVKIATGAVTTTKLVDDAIIAAKIAANAVTNVKIATDAVTDVKIAANAVTTTKILDNAIATAKIAANAITTAKIGTGQVTATQILDRTINRVDVALAGIQGENVADRTLAAGKIIANTITGGEIAANTITAAQVAANAITATHIAAETITSNEIGAEAITADKIAAGSIVVGSDRTTFAAGYDPTTKETPTGAQAKANAAASAAETAAKTHADTVAKTEATTAAKPANDRILLWERTGTTYIDGGQIFTDSVTANQIAAGAITTSEIAANAVTANEIAANTITAAKIAASTITATQIAATTITAAKIASSTITATQIASNAITAVKIAANAVTSDKILANAVTAAKIAAGTITANEISTGAITAEKVAAEAITADKIAAGAIVVGSNQTTFASGYDPTDMVALTKRSGIELIPNAYRTNLNPETLPFSVSRSNNPFEIVPITEVEPENTSGENIVKTMNYSTLRTEFLPFDPNAWNYVSVDVLYKENTNGTVYFQTTFYDKNFKAVAANDAAKNLISARAITSTDVWHKFEGSDGPIDPSDVRYTAAYISIRVLIRYGGGGVGPSYMRNISWKQLSPQFIANNRELVSQTNDRVKLWERTGTTFIDGGQIFTDSITANQIAAGAITTSEIATGAVTANEIAANAITADKIAANAITIGSGTNFAAGYDPSTKATTAEVTAAVKPANDRIKLWEHTGTTYISGGQIFTDSITANQIAAGAVTTSEIATNAVTANEIAAGTITAANIAATTITGAKLVANTITTKEIAANTITASNIAATTITGAEIASNAITAVKITGRTITADKIVSSAITANEIAANTITAAKIAGTTITGDKIAASTISGNKLVASTITTDKIAARAITAEKIATGSITADLISTAGLSADVIKSGTIGANTVFAGRLQAATGTFKGEVEVGDFYTTSGLTKVTGSGIESDYIKIISSTQLIRNKAILTAGVLELSYMDQNYAIDGTVTSTIEMTANGLNVESSMSVNGDLTAYGRVNLGQVGATMLEVTGQLNSWSGAAFLGTTIFDNSATFNKQVSTSGTRYHYGQEYDYSSYEPITNRNERGFCGVAGYPTQGTFNSIGGVGVNFRKRRAWTPSSIGLSSTSSYTGGVTYTDMTADGFWLYITGNGSTNYQYWRGYYTAY